MDINTLQEKHLNASLLHISHTILQAYKGKINLNIKIRRKQKWNIQNFAKK